MSSCVSPFTEQSLALAPRATPRLILLPRPPRGKSRPDEGNHAKLFSRTSPPTLSYTAQVLPPPRPLCTLQIQTSVEETTESLSRFFSPMIAMFDSCLLRPPLLSFFSPKSVFYMADSLPRRTHFQRWSPWLLPELSPSRQDTDGDSFRK